MNIRPNHVVKLHAFVFVLWLFSANQIWAACVANPAGSSTHYLCDAYIQGTRVDAIAECGRWASESFGVVNPYCNGPGNSTEGLIAAGNYQLLEPDGVKRFYFLRVNYESGCVGGLQDRETRQCLSKNSQCGVGNPCSPADGRKFAMERDQMATPVTLGIERYYSSGFANQDESGNAGFGVGWRNNFHYRAFRDTRFITLVRPDGRAERAAINGNLVDPDVDSSYRFSINGDGNIVVTTEDDGTEVYSPDGLIRNKTKPNGEQLSFEYLSGFKLSKVNNNYGSTLRFIYSNDQLAKIILNEVIEFQYEYDEYANLTVVVYPDSTPQDDTDNPYRQYHYENPDFPNHLTGITDENGDRIATYAYDANGKAIVTEHAQTTNPVGQERFELDYQGAN